MRLELHPNTNSQSSDYASTLQMQFSVSQAPETGRRSVSSNLRSLRLAATILNVFMALPSFSVGKSWQSRLAAWGRNHPWTLLVKCAGQVIHTKPVGELEVRWSPSTRALRSTPGITAG